MADSTPGQLEDQITGQDGVSVEYEPEEIDILTRRISRLREPDRSVLRARLEGDLLKDIAAQKGITRERVRQIESRALRRLARMYDRPAPLASVTQIVGRTTAA